MEADEASPPPRPPPWAQNKSAAAMEASSGPLAAAAARLSARSRALPSSRDFHFYNNFPAFGSSSSVKVAKDKAAAPGTKAKVPFHIPTIPRPQNVYRIVVDNSSKPFEHALLEQSEDGTRAVHPLEKLPIEQLIDRNVPYSEPVKPPALGDTPFTFVEDLKTLEVLATKLKSATEFAVDLEHNHYRSFQGLTCLMQISTRTEDFIVDTLKLRKYLGDYLREFFRDPTKRKVMHGAGRDIIWLQRDFSIYVCNLFDTGQASKVLQMDRNSLEHLLQHFCGVTANKEYQAADWRLRPLPDEMIKYAREDTHYLLYIYDLMRLRLVKESSDGSDMLLEVCKRSNEICLQLYEKEQLTDSSYLHIHGLKEIELDARQLSVLSSLYRWRDGIARAEDESTGYILPNKSLLEIAKEMPVTSGKLKRMVKSKNFERHLNTVINTIRDAISASGAFASIAEQLKKGKLEELTVTNAMNSSEDAEMIPVVDVDNNEDAIDESAVVSTVITNVGTASPCVGTVTSGASFDNMHLEDFTPENENFGNSSRFTGQADKGTLSNGPQQVAKATVQASKRTTAFGALFGKPAAGRRPNLFQGFSNDQGKSKVDKITSSVVLPFHNFSGSVKPPSGNLPLKEQVHSEPESIQHSDPACQTEDVIQLDTETDDPQPPESCNDDEHEEPKDMEMSKSPSDVPSDTEQRFQSLDEERNVQQNQRAPQEPEFRFPLVPFDYAEARKNLVSGEPKAERKKDDAVARPINMDSGDKKLTSNKPGVGENDGSFQHPRRRQAFPPSGNRNFTYH
ncbi:hypothetical protein PVAP13_9NG321900 [Panicum virgatum]|uniref:HRDC domain-containing protein n=1 Tax=Panicum virgatum TaxID=38727 RepID=A0A8T0MKX5_PANVG|nr:hypothetical protein PVAP13_9NG321900 [Panicum virgatum]